MDPKEIKLGPDEAVEGRPDFDPSHSAEDLQRMRAMAHQLVETYEDPKLCDFSARMGPVCQSDPKGRHFRIYYIRPELLFNRKPLTVVGFFGLKRPGADIHPLIQADKLFEREFPHHPGLLSLSTVRLPDGNFGNLVLFTDPDAKDSWNHSQPHQDLVMRISPPYYRAIRLNNGVLPDGLAVPDSLRLTRVRYIDYAAKPTWRALRTF